MLLEFRFENFKCYRDETVLSMEPASITEHAESLLQGLGGSEFLPVSVLYGPNGGGKSSVLQAFSCMLDLVRWPYFLMKRKGVKDGKMPVISCEPYAFDDASRDEPTTFCALFERGEHIYRYIIAVSKGEVVEEYLHRRKPGKGATATIFERRDGSIDLGSTMRRKGVSTSIDPMMPYLSYLAVNHDFQPVKEAFGWMLSCRELDYSRDFTEQYFMEPEDDDEKAGIVQMLKAMDVNIADIRYQHAEDGKLEGIFLKHNGGGDHELELAEESSGTVKLLNLVPPVMVALGKGQLVISDELDAKLHPKLLKYLIKLFTDRRTNPHGAQLIFTSHDMSTLNSAIFRRDEIRFAARSPHGPSTLYALSDIVDVDGRRVRPQNAYDRQYLEGRYGADPYLRSMLDWDNAHEQ